MWVSKNRIEKLEKKLSDLEVEIQNQNNQMLFHFLHNSVLKEEYNFKLLITLFEKLGLEKPTSEYKF